MKKSRASKRLRRLHIAGGAEGRANNDAQTPVFVKLPEGCLCGLDSVVTPTAGGFSSSF